jgi:hypothetical protein
MSEVQLQVLAQRDSLVEGTPKLPVPATGRATVYVASDIIGDKYEAMRTFIHESGNALAQQKFAGGDISGAYRGARGMDPGIEQRTGDNPLRDPDIGYQIERCVFGPVIQVPGTTVTVRP